MLPRASAPLTQMIKTEFVAAAKMGAEKSAARAEEEAELEGRQ